MTIAIAGGGTGGHLMPALAVAEELRRADAARVFFIGTARGLEAKLVPPAGYELRFIHIGGLKGGGRGSWARRLRSVGQIVPAIAACLKILRQTRAEVVFGIGGYASGPALAAAALLRIPVVVLEVNARVGLANRLAAPWVRAAAVNFPETARTFHRAGQVQVTGIPVRPEFFSAQRPAGDTGPPWVLISGGSQGAHALNATVRGMALDLARRGPMPFRLRHQTGPADYAAIATAYAQFPDTLVAEPFLTDMAAAMAAASMVVGRSGASTLGELAAMGRASILVPFPGAADQHQLRNAQAYAEAGAARLIEQSALTPQSLAVEIEGLLTNPDERHAMEHAAAGFAHPHAARDIARMVMDAVRARV